MKSFRPGWAIQWVQGWPGLHSDHVSQSKQRVAHPVLSLAIRLGSLSLIPIIHTVEGRRDLPPPSCPLMASTMASTHLPHSPHKISQYRNVKTKGQNSIVNSSSVKEWGKSIFFLLIVHHSIVLRVSILCPHCFLYKSS